jgi:outer membrane lipoprotein-sorting protein
MLLTPTPVLVAMSQDANAQISQISQRAQEILQECAKTHLKLVAFSANFRVALEERNKGKVGVQNALGDVAFQRPGKSRLNAQLVDGTDVTVVCDNQFRYRLSSKSEGFYLKDTVTPGDAALAQAIHDANAFGSPTFLEFTTSPQALAHLFISKPRAYSFGPEEELDGVRCYLVTVEVPTSSPGVSGHFTFAIGKTDHLLRRLEMVFGDDQNGLTLTEEFDDVKANPTLEPSVFAFDPPEGLKPRAGTRLTTGGKSPIKPAAKPATKPVTKPVAKPPVKPKATTPVKATIPTPNRPSVKKPR